MEHFDLKGGGPCTPTHLEFMEGAVLDGGDSEAAIYNHRHCLPHHIHETYSALVSAPF